MKQNWQNIDNLVEQGHGYIKVCYTLLFRVYMLKFSIIKSYIYICIYIYNLYINFSNKTKTILYKHIIICMLYPYTVMTKVFFNI